MIRLKLKKALSYSGIVVANEKYPYVTVESQKVADKAVKTGYFDIVESKLPPKEEPNKTESELHTKTSLKKLNKEQQEEIIIQLGLEPSEAKNEEERISLILEWQETNQEEQGE